MLEQSSNPEIQKSSNPESSAPRHRRHQAHAHPRLGHSSTLPAPFKPPPRIPQPMQHKHDDQHQIGQAQQLHRHRLPQDPIVAGNLDGPRSRHHPLRCRQLRLSSHIPVAVIPVPDRPEPNPRGEQKTEQKREQGRPRDREGAHVCNTPGLNRPTSGFSAQASSAVISTSRVRAGSMIASTHSRAAP